MMGMDTVDADHKALPSSASALLSQGAACNVLYLNTVDMESLTGAPVTETKARVAARRLRFNVTETKCHVRGVIAERNPYGGVQLL